MTAAELGEVIIAGAGIGGLTLACALRQQGFSCRVFERAAVLGPVGAGITVQSNAMRTLRRLGVDEAVAAAGAEISRAEIRNPAGRVLAATDLRLPAEEAGAPSIALHRARLHAVLLRAAGEGTVHTGRAVTGYEQQGDHVLVHLEDGASVRAGLLVGADGLRSRVRAQLVGDGDPVYAGYTSWRGVSPGADRIGAGHTSETLGRGERFGIVPIGHREVYWFAVADAPPGGRDGDVVAELLERFGAWHAPIRELIACTPPERILRTDIADRPPLSRWHDGRVVLLGDAAHPMTPNLGQGGCQAIEDAVVLAECLAREAGLSAALAAYERRRVERANGIVRAARRLGAVFQWSNPAACALRDTLFRLTPPGVALRPVRELFCHEL